MKTNELAADLLHELLEYRDGELYWKQPGKSRQMGRPAGGINGDGYRRVKINRKLYAVHRLVWVMHGNDPVPFVDHINGDVLDNRIENLRAATHSQNCMKWYGCITLDYKVYPAGYFDSKEDAAAAVDKLRKELHGEFARS